MENATSNIHIGHIIQAQLKTDQRSVSWLAKQLHCSRNHLYKVFKKPSLDNDLLLAISVAMQYNFFQYYTEAFKEGLEERVGKE